MVTLEVKGSIAIVKWAFEGLTFEMVLNHELRALRETLMEVRKRYDAMTAEQRERFWIATTGTDEDRAQFWRSLGVTDTATRSVGKEVTVAEPGRLARVCQDCGQAIGEFGNPICQPIISRSPGRIVCGPEIYCKACVEAHHEVPRG